MESTQKWVASARLLINRIIFIGRKAEDILDTKTAIKTPVKDRLKNILTEMSENAEGTATIIPVLTTDTMSNKDIMDIVGQLVLIYNPTLPSVFQHMDLGVSRENVSAILASLEESVVKLPEEYVAAWNAEVPKDLGQVHARAMLFLGHIMKYYDERYNEIKAFDATRGPRKKKEELGESEV